MHNARSHNAKLAQVQNFHTMNAIRTLREFLVKIRDEVHTFAFADLEKAFGEQTVETLEAIDKGVRKSLQEVDFKWFKGIERNYKNTRLRPEIMAITKPGAPIDELSLVFVAAIRDETLDLLAQYAQEYLVISNESTNAWVNSLTNRPTLDPRRIIEELRKRRHVVGRGL